MFNVYCVVVFKFLVGCLEVEENVEVGKKDCCLREVLFINGFFCEISF